MKKLTFFLALITIIILPNSSYCQNIDPRIQEVYGNMTEELVSKDPDRLKFLNDLLQNRLTIEKTQKNLEGYNIQKLSEVPLFNKFNPGLKRDAEFNPNSFNPLKYLLNFYSFEIEPVYYIIDNTDYIIVIKSQGKRN